MPERLRAQRAASRLFLAMIVALGVLVLSVWMLGERAKSDIRASELKARQAQIVRDETGRVAQTAQLRSGCARAVARDFEAWETNHDLAGFMHDAARAWREAGNRRVPRRYERRAGSAEARMASIALRLPARKDQATVAVFCRELYPDPPKP